MLAELTRGLDSGAKRLPPSPCWRPSPKEEEATAVARSHVRYAQRPERG